MLRDFQAILGRSQKHDATRLPDGNRRRDIAVEEKLLDAHDVGLIFLDQGVKPIVELHEPVFHASLGTRRQSAVCMRHETASLRGHEAKAADRRARINAQRQHAFSSMKTARPRLLRTYSSSNS